MDFTMTVMFETKEGMVIERTVAGQFYPSDNPFKIEDLLWLMAEEYGRPEQIKMELKFWGDGDGSEVRKLIESRKATSPR